MTIHTLVRIFGIAAVLWCAAFFPKEAAAQCAVSWSNISVSGINVSTEAAVGDYYGTGVPGCGNFFAGFYHEYSVVIDTTCGAQHQQVSNFGTQPGGGGVVGANDTIIVTASPSCQIYIYMTIWCSALNAPILEIYDGGGVAIWSVSITDYNFNNPDPANDTVTVVTSGPGNGQLTVQATSDEDPTVTLYQETVGPNTYQIAFQPQGQSMPPGTWTGIAATFAQAQTTIPITQSGSTRTLSR